VNNDAVSELSRLREKYPSIIIQGRGKKIDASADLLVQYWFKNETNIKCRLARPHKTKYINIFEFEPILMMAIKGEKAPVLGKVLAGPRDLPPMAYGKGLIGMLGGISTWCGSKYVAVYLPENPEFLLPSWRGWLRFMEWTGKNPHRRKWSESQRYMLMSCGQYAWIVAMDRGAKQAKVLYSGGAKIEYESSWFSLEHPEELQKTLVIACQHADEKKWRDKELSGLDLTKAINGFDDPIQKKKDYMKKYRKHKRAARGAETPPPEIELDVENLKARVEITRVPDPDDEFSDPLTPDGWNGDLGQRYRD
jgi:hypothetical protein